MSYTVQFSPAARDQLAELEDYINKTASPAATSTPLSRIAKGLPRSRCVAADVTTF